MGRFVSSENVVRLILIANVFPTLESFTVVHRNQHRHTPITTPSGRSRPFFSDVQTTNSDHCVLYVSSDDFVVAEDLPAIQSLFSKYCDKDGLMSIEDLRKVPPFAEMLVSFIYFIDLEVCVPVKNRIYSSRITPRQCRRNILSNEVQDVMAYLSCIIDKSFLIFLNFFVLVSKG